MARIALAISLTLFGAIGGLLIPGVGQTTALLPILSFILVLPQTSRRWLVMVSLVTIAATLVILGVEATGSQPAPRDDLVMTLFRDAILVGVVVLILAGLGDFAMESRDALRDLRTSAQRQLRIATARLSLIGALRLIRRQPTAEATATSIASPVMPDDSGLE